MSHALLVYALLVYTNSPLDGRVASSQIKDPRYATWCSCPKSDALILTSESNNDSSGCKQVKTQLEDRYRAVPDRNQPINNPGMIKPVLSLVKNECSSTVSRMVRLLVHIMIVHRLVRPVQLLLELLPTSEVLDILGLLW